MPTALHRALPTALLAFATAAAPALAQEGVGTVTGTLDLADARWVVAGPGEAPSSSWRRTDGTYRIRLVATPRAGGGAGAGTLTIEIVAETGATEARATEARVTLAGEGRDYRASPENVDLTLTAAEPEGGDIAVTGSFQATLTPGGAEGLVIETEAGRTLDGDFQATVPAAEDGPA